MSSKRQKNDYLTVPEMSIEQFESKSKEIVQLEQALGRAVERGDLFSIQLLQKNIKELETPAKTRIAQLRRDEEKESIEAQRFDKELLALLNKVGTSEDVVFELMTTGTLTEKKEVLKRLAQGVVPTDIPVIAKATGDPTLALPAPPQVPQPTQPQPALPLPPPQAGGKLRRRNVIFSGTGFK